MLTKYVSRVPALRPAKAFGRNPVPVEVKEKPSILNTLVNFYLGATFVPGFAIGVHHAGSRGDTTIDKIKSGISGGFLFGRICTLFPGTIWMWFTGELDLKFEGDRLIVTQK